MAADAALFPTGKCEKPLYQPHLQHQESEKKRQLILGLGGNLEDRHEELECQRLQLLNPFLRENLQFLHEAHDHEKLECRRAAPQSAAKTKNRKRPSALPPAVPPAVAHDIQRDLGHVDNLLGNRTQRIEKRRTSTSCSPISGTGT